MFVVVLTPWTKLAEIGHFFLVVELITAAALVLHYSKLAALIAYPECHTCGRNAE